MGTAAARAILERAWYDAGRAAALLEEAGGAPESVAVLSGRLVLSKSGYGLLEVPNALVRGLSSALDVPGAELPLRDGRLKAHATVFRPGELEAIGGPGKVSEWGERFSCQIGPIKEVEPSGREGVSRVWDCSIRSGELQSLRMSYGLSPLPDNNRHDFHVTIARRVATPSAQRRRESRRERRSDSGPSCRNTRSGRTSGPHVPTRR